MVRVTIAAIVMVGAGCIVACAPSLRPQDADQLRSTQQLLGQIYALTRLSPLRGLVEPTFFERS